MEELIKINNNAIQIQQDFIEQYKAFQETKAIMEMQEKELKAQLLERMEELGIKSFECDGLKITYKNPSTRKVVDTNALKEQGLYDMFTKESDVKASVQITIK